MNESEDNANSADFRANENLWLRNEDFGTSKSIRAFQASPSCLVSNHMDREDMAQFHSGF